MKLRLKLATPHGQTNPNFLWLCRVDGNAGDAAAIEKYGLDKKLMTLSFDLFDGPMSVRTHPLIVTALRIHLGLVSAGENQWQIVAAALEQIPDAAAAAAALGYDINEWL